MTRRLPRLLTFALAVPATLRLTRFITTDWLGEWVIDKPARDWANSHEAPEVAEGWKSPATVDPENGWRSKLVHGLECPFCVGFWLGLLVLITAAVTPRALRPVLNVVLGALGLNYLVGHVSSRID